MASSNSLEITYQQSVRDETVNSIEDTEENGTSSSQDQRIFQSKKRTIKIIVWFVKLLLFGGVLTCLVLSKLTIIKITAELHLLSNFSIIHIPNDTPKGNSLTCAANLYWMLFFIVMIPNLIAWIRAIFNGLLTKSPSHPWPKRSAMLGVSEVFLNMIISCKQYIYIYIYK